MAVTYSNELKAVVVTENFLENPMSVMRENCLTIQKFSYDCVHKRNSAGEVYGPTEPVILSFKVRVNSPYHAKAFYFALGQNHHYDFSLLFNVTFGANDRLADYEDGMVVNGYVVEVEEAYHSAKDEEGHDEQMMLNVKVLVRSAIYLGKEKNFINTFIQ